MNLFKDISFQWAAAAYIGLASFALSVLLARFMGPETFGTYNYVLSIAAIFAIIQDFGYRLLIQREKTKPSANTLPQAQTLISNSLGHLLVSTAVGALIAFLVFDETGFLVAMAIAVSGVKVLTSLLSACLKGDGLFQKEALWQFHLRSLTFILILASWMIWERLDITLLAWFTGLGIAAVLPSVIGYFSKVSFKWPKQTLQVCLAFLVIDAATAIYFRCDIVMLELMTGDTALTGHYAAGFRLLEGVIFFMAPLSQIFFRQLRLQWQSANDFNRSIKTQLGTMVIAGGSIFGAYILFGETLVVFGFGDDYAITGEVSVWLFLSFIFILPNAVLTQAFIAANKEWYYAACAIAAAATNIALNWYLIPDHGMWGAAIATFLTEGLLFVLLFIIYGKGILSRHL